MTTPSSFNLLLIRPMQSQTFNVVGIDVKGIGGSFFIGHDHAPLVSLLQPRERLIFTTVDGNVHEILVTGGLISVDETKALVILND